MILQGRCISPGLFEGRAHTLDARRWLEAATGVEARGDPDAELERLRAAQALASIQLEQMGRQLSQHGRRENADIFTAHLAMMRDPVLLERIEAGIQASGLSAEAAVAAATRSLYAEFESSRTAMVHDKAPDVLDIGQRLLVCLDPQVESNAVASGATVLVAATLTPSELVRAHETGPCAALTETCGERSHVAILARSLGIPLLSGIDGVGGLIREGARVVMDAATGVALVDPDDDEQPEAQRIVDALRETLSVVPEPRQPISRDGQSVRLALNVSGPRDAEHVQPLGAVGIGLLRTEFLYMTRPSWPDEDACLEVFEAISAAIGEGELHIRLADFGADKRPDYADFPLSRNPSLGARGVRLLLQRDDILAPQVRALARLATRRPVVVLVPMLDGVDTLHRLTDRLERLCHARSGQLPFALGAMIEVPAAALCIEEILDGVSHAAIGLNDLTQYVMAADREDESVEPYHDALQPAILRLVDRVVAACEARGKPLSVCGELAGSRALTAALLALGIRSFSVSRPDYAALVDWIERVSLIEITKQREALLEARSGAEVRRIVESLQP